MTRRALAERAAMPERTVVSYEKGEREPPQASIETFAQILSFPIAFFSRAGTDRVLPESVSFRSLSRTPANHRARALAAGELALELSLWLDERFSLPPSQVPDFGGQRDPEAAAMAVRSRWGLGESPISNMIWLLEAKGVRVFSLAEDSRDVDAFSFWKGKTSFVFLNTAKSSERSRFDAAHELGHLVLHQNNPPNGREAEREADAFASAFLMPAASVLAHAPRFASIDRLVRAKHYWRVSVSALAVRMHQVGVLTDWNYRNLMVELQHSGFRKKEPEMIPREMSQVFRKVFLQLRNEGIRRRELARELDWPVSELDALIFELVLASLPGGSGQGGRGSVETKKRLSVIS